MSDNSFSNRNFPKHPEGRANWPPFPVISHIKDDYYKMTHPKRGIAVVFNHFKFKNQPQRDGTQFDCDKMKETLKSLSFEVVTHTDLEYFRIEDELQKVARLNHTDHDCLVIVVMTHGIENKLLAYDQEYCVSTLWNQFTAEKCPSLAGKPKLFFIQACRGEIVGQGKKCLLQFDGNCGFAPFIKVPNMADFLIMYSTPLGYYSLRDPERGTWFIQMLCSELNRTARIDDLNMILTRVNRFIALGYEIIDPSDKLLNGAKQIGQMQTSLTRLVHFYKSLDD